MSRVLRRTVLASLLAAALAVVPAWAKEQQGVRWVASNAWLRKPPPGLDAAAVYFTVRNDTNDAMVVVGVKSPLAGHAMIHATSTIEGQSRMRMREKMTVPAKGSLVFAPEGLHVMLTALTKTLEVGDKVPVTLELDDGGAIDIVATVRPLDAQ